MENTGNLAVEGGVAPLVIANALLVDPNMRTVISRTDVQKRTRAGERLEIEIALVPEHALIVEKLGDLRVPVTRDAHGWRGGEIVLLVVRADDVGVFVQRVRLVVDRTIGIVESACGGLIDEVMPITIQTGNASVVDAHEKRLKRPLRESGRGREKQSKREASQDLVQVSTK